MKRRIFSLVVPILLSVGIFVITSFEVNAAGLVPDKCEVGYECSACELLELANNVITWLIGILVVIFAVLVAVAGFRMVVSGGNTSAKDAAKSSISSALIGFLLVLAAWLIVDTLLRTLLPDGTVGGTPWNRSIDCNSFKQVRPTAESDIYEQVDPLNIYTPRDVTSTGGGGGGGGVCEPLSSGPCSVTNLQSYFGSRAEDASRICNKESGGAPINSKTDKCADGKSFSGGLFQINIISEADKIPGCIKSELVKNPNLSNGGIGDCAVPRVLSSNGKVYYCPKRQCEFKSEAMYNTCMRAVRVQEVNLSVAKKLFDARGFQPWDYSRKACNLPK